MSSAMYTQSLLSDESFLINFLWCRKEKSTNEKDLPNFYNIAKNFYEKINHDRKNYFTTVKDYINTNFPNKIKIGILGGNIYRRAHSKDKEDIGNLFKELLTTFTNDSIFITGGQSQIQLDFNNYAKTLSLSNQIINLYLNDTNPCEGWASLSSDSNTLTINNTILQDCNTATDSFLVSLKTIYMHDKSSIENISFNRNFITASLCDVYLLVTNSPGVLSEAIIAYLQGALIIPLFQYFDSALDSNKLLDNDFTAVAYILCKLSWKKIFGKLSDAECIEFQNNILLKSDNTYIISIIQKLNSIKEFIKIKKLYETANGKHYSLIDEINLSYLKVYKKQSQNIEPLFNTISQKTNNKFKIGILGGYLPNQEDKVTDIFIHMIKTLSKNNIFITGGAGATQLYFNKIAQGFNRTVEKNIETIIINLNISDPEGPTYKTNTISHEFDELFKPLQYDDKNNYFIDEPLATDLSQDIANVRRIQQRRSYSHCKLFYKAILLKSNEIKPLERNTLTASLCNIYFVITGSEATGYEALLAYLNGAVIFPFLFNMSPPWKIFFEKLCSLSCFRLNIPVVKSIVVNGKSIQYLEDFVELIDTILKSSHRQDTIIKSIDSIMSLLTQICSTESDNGKNILTPPIMTFYKSDLVKKWLSYIEPNKWKIS